MMNSVEFLLLMRKRVLFLPLDGATPKHKRIIFQIIIPPSFGIGFSLNPLFVRLLFFETLLSPYTSSCDVCLEDRLAFLRFQPGIDTHIVRVHPQSTTPQPGSYHSTRRFLHLSVYIGHLGGPHCALKRHKYAIPTMARAARQTRPRAVGRTLSSPNKQPQPLPTYHPYQSPPRSAAVPIPSNGDTGYESSNFDLAALDFSTPNPYQPSSPYDYPYGNSTTPESLSGSFQPYPQPLPSWSQSSPEDKPDDYDSLFEPDTDSKPTPKGKGKTKAADPAYIPRPRNAFMLYRSDLVGLVKEGKIPEAFVQATNDYQRREKERLEGESAAKIASGSSPSDGSEDKPRKKPSKPKPNARPVAPETEEVLGKGRTGGNVPQSTQSKILSIMWKDFVSPSEKKVWYAKALKEKEEVSDFGDFADNSMRRNIQGISSSQRAKLRWRRS
jgi:hypothetical protein